MFSLKAFSSLARQNADLINEPSLVDIATKYNTSAQIILLAWAMTINVGVIPKSSNPQRIIENAIATSIRLTDDEVAKLSKLDRNKNYTKCEGWTVL